MIGRLARGLRPAARRRRPVALAAARRRRGPRALATVAVARVAAVNPRAAFVTTRTTEESIHVFYESKIVEGPTTLLALVAPFLPERAAFKGVPYDSLDGLVAAAPYAPGDVVIFSIRSGVQTRDVPGSETRVDGACAYTFAAGDALLLAPAVMTLLEQPTPLTLIDEGDWGCKMALPETMHNVMRSSYGTNGVMDHAALFPFGAEYDPFDEFLAATKSQTPVLERPFAFGIQEHITYRKPSRFYEDLQLNVTVRNWHELPALLAFHFDRDDAGAHLAALHGAVMDWNDAWKRRVAGSIYDFRTRATTGQIPTNDCARVGLTAEQEAAQDAAFEAYYAQDHWFDNYHDGVWEVGAWCSKFLQYSEHTELSEGGCFADACAPAAAAAFVCGGDAPDLLAIPGASVAAAVVSGWDWANYATVAVLAAVALGAVVLVAVRRRTAARLAAYARLAYDGLSPRAGEAHQVFASLKTFGFEAGLMSATIGNLIGLTFMNAYVMRRAPLAASLTAVQMACTSVFATLSNAYRGRPFFGGISFGFWVCRVVPLAALFAVYLFTSNLVYSYLGVGFIQMLKPANGIMLFALTLSIGLEGRPDATKVLNVFVISGAVVGTALAKEGSDPGAVNGFGITVMAISTVAATLYQTGIQLLMQHRDHGLDAVSLLAVMAPTTTVILAVYAALTEWTRGDFLALVLDVPPGYIALDLVLSVALDVNKNLVIGLLSAVSYCLVGYSKDILIVAFTAAAGSEHVSDAQWVAYALLVLGQTAWTAEKLAARLDADAVETAIARKRARARVARPVRPPVPADHGGPRRSPRQPPRARRRLAAVEPGTSGRDGAKAAMFSTLLGRRRV
ncbi:hypothetical protein JL722_11653 [Aureococcus anophagefferens]|nr:hypothetical protein JL722_11653 [Aureococcus anophagefferens]